MRQLIALLVLAMTCVAASHAQWVPYLGIQPGGDIRRVVQHNGVVYSSGAGSSIVQRSQGESAWTTRYPAIENGWQTVYSSMLSVGDVIYATTSSGPILRSTDDGTTWTVDINPPDVMTSLASHGSTVIAAGIGGRLYRSTNDGFAWRVMVDYNVLRPTLRSLVYDGNTIYAASTNAGVYRSTDDGESWDTLNRGLSDLRAQAIIVHDSIVYVGTRNGIYQSADPAQGWTDISTGLGSLDILSLAVVGTNLVAGTTSGVYHRRLSGGSWNEGSSMLTTERVHVLRTVDTFLYAGTEMGLFISSDEGVTWRPDNDEMRSHWFGNLITHKGRLVATTSSGVAQQKSEQAEWETTNRGLPFGNISDVTSDSSSLYVSIYDEGVFRYDAERDAWIDESKGLPTRRIQSVHTTPEHMVVGTMDAGVFRRSRSDSTWVPADGGLTSLFSRQLFSCRDVLLNATDKGLFYSTNAGDQWSLHPWLFVTHLASIDSVVVATNYDGTILYRSTDCGQTLDVMPGFPLAIPVQGMLVHDSVLIAGTSRGTVYVSSDTGRTWSQRSQLLPEGADIKSMTILDGKIYASTPGRGIYVLDLADITSSVDDDSRPTANMAIIGEPFPSPADNVVQLMLRPSHPNASHPRVYVVDTYGSLVSTGVNDLQIDPQGTTIVWNCANVPSGVYTVVLHANNEVEGRRVVISR